VQKATKITDNPVWLFCIRDLTVRWYHFQDNVHPCWHFTEPDNASWRQGSRHCGSMSTSLCPGHVILPSCEIVMWLSCDHVIMWYCILHCHVILSCDIVMWYCHVTVMWFLSFDTVMRFCHVKRSCDVVMWQSCDSHVTVMWQSN